MKIIDIKTYGTNLGGSNHIFVKVLTDELATDDQFLTRFRREADALSRLSHPNIVTVLERGEVDGRPYLAMEYVEGPSLRQVMREGELPPPEALKIVSSVLSALQHAHDKGIVHRDIKPENVLLARGHVVKVADFGLSRLVDGPDMTRLTRTNLVLGTYEYMAPEQREHAREADHRADLYATGVILYEMLTGGLPIGRFAMPSRSRPGECDARIDRLVERSLENDPADRYQDADEMAGAVSGILEKSGEWEEPAGDPALRYRPAKFEHHIDNLATIDQVLGTVFYVLGVMTLFGMSRLPFFWGGGFGFIALFVMGWYLRETGEELRKYKQSAKTAQAVISILAGFTLILLPFTIYSFWVLFGHRGRTYYDARNRGLSEREAASHTYEVLESDIGTPAPKPAPPPSPRPSRIPVQSMVVSETDGAPPRRRISWLVWLGLIPIVVAAILTIARLDGAGIDEDVIWTFFWIGQPLLAAGMLHGAFSKRARGAWLAGALMVAAGGGAIAFEMEDQRRDRYSEMYGPSTVRFAQPRRFAVDVPEVSGLTEEQARWIRTVTGFEEPLPVRVYRDDRYVVARVDRGFLRERPKDAQALLIAAEQAILRARPTAFRRNIVHYADSARAEYLRARYDSQPSAWDEQAARVWIATFRRGPKSAGEELPITKKQREWLAGKSGFSDTEKLKLVVEGRLVHAELTKGAFHREPEAAWKLVLAVQHLVESTWPERRPETRSLWYGDVGLTSAEHRRLNADLRREPPPGAE